MGFGGGVQFGSPGCKNIRDRIIRLKSNLSIPGMTVLDNIFTVWGVYLIWGEHPIESVKAER
jgi:hypothetical protein